MKKAAASQAQRIFPFQYGPFAFRKNIFHDADHFDAGKFSDEHLSDGFSSMQLLEYNLVIDCIVGVQCGQRFNVGAVKSDSRKR